MRLLFSFCLLCILSQCAIAQMGLGALFQEKDLQSRAWNPAFYDENDKFQVGLLSLNADFYHSAGNSADIFSRNEDDNWYLDMEQLVSEVADQNQVAYDLEFMTAYVGLNLSGWQIGVFHQIRSHGQLDYRGDMARVLWYGNANYIGETLDLDLATQQISFNQLGVNIARSVGKFQLGLNVNRLFGNALVYTERDHIQMTTGAEYYQINMQTDLSMLTSSSFSLSDGYTLDIDEESLFQAAFTENTGWSLDLGMQSHLSEKISVQAFVRDLGSMTFVENNERIYSNENYEYKGALLEDGLDEDGLDYGIDLDSIYNDLELQSESHGDIEYQLPASWGLGVNYKIKPRLSVRALYAQRQNFDRSSWRVMAHAGLGYRLFNFLELRAHYSYQYEDHNIGTGFNLLLGPVRFYAHTDNLLLNRTGQHLSMMTGIAFIL